MADCVRVYNSQSLEWDASDVQGLKAVTQAWTTCRGRFAKCAYLSLYRQEYTLKPVISEDSTRRMDVDGTAPPKNAKTWDSIWRAPKDNFVLDYDGQGKCLPVKTDARPTPTSKRGAQEGEPPAVRVLPRMCRPLGKCRPAQMNCLRSLLSDYGDVRPKGRAG